MQSITLNNAIQCNSVHSSTQEISYNSVEEWQNFHYLNGALITHIPKIISLDILQEKIGYSFHNKNLLIQALTHTSFTHESIGKSSLSNERLEFLGDSIINFIITSVLFETYSKFHEGELSKMRGALVNENKFAELAEALNLSINLFIGKGEWKQKGHCRVGLLADSFEALMGAIYIDAGVDQVEKTFKKLIVEYKTIHKKDFISEKVLVEFDAKTQLQELCMSLYQEHPRYEAFDLENGFKVAIWLKNRCLVEGIGASKKKLEKELARIVLSEKKYQI